MNIGDLSVIYDRMAANWPSEFVARKKIEEFSGGMFNGKTMANIEADKTKESPPKVKVGRNVGYPKRPLVEWMKRRTVIV